MPDFNAPGNTEANAGLQSRAGARARLATAHSADRIVYATSNGLLYAEVDGQKVFAMDPVTLTVRRTYDFSSITPTQFHDIFFCAELDLVFLTIGGSHFYKIDPSNGDLTFIGAAAASRLTFNPMDGLLYAGLGGIPNLGRAINPADGSTDHSFANDSIFGIDFCSSEGRLAVSAVRDLGGATYFPGVSESPFTSLLQASGSPAPFFQDAGDLVCVGSKAYILWDNLGSNHNEIAILDVSTNAYQTSIPLVDPIEDTALGANVAYIRSIQEIWVPAGDKIFRFDIAGESFAGVIEDSRFTNLRDCVEAAGAVYVTSATASKFDYVMKIPFP